MVDSASERLLPVAIQSEKPIQQNRLLVELCAGGVDDVLLAAGLGVDRIELNSGMAVGGLTPSAGLASFARATFSGPIIAMVRPREGGFAYSNAEFHQMLTDAELLLAAGLDGIAIGFLTSEGGVDEIRCCKVRALFPSATLVFHKAFDATPNLDAALGQLTNSGFDRVLTSGGMKTASEGAAVLKRLHEKASQAVEILPGGGIRASNVESLLETTGCNQFHSAVRQVCEDSSMQHTSELHFGLPGETNGSFGRASEDQLKSLLAAVSHRRAI